MKTRTEKLREIVDEFPNHERQVKHIFAKENVSHRAYEVMMKFMAYQKATLLFVSQIADALDSIGSALDEAEKKDKE